MAMNPRLLRPTANDSPASIPGLALWLDASAADALYTTDAGPVTAVSSPLDISGCVGWYDSGDLSAMKQNSDGTGEVTVGDPVGYWADKSASGQHVSQATSTRRPTLTGGVLNGRSSLVFDGTDDTLLRASYTAQSNLGGLTRIAVLESTGTGIRAFSRANGGAGFFHFLNGNIRNYVDAAFTGDLGYTGVHPALISTSVFDGAAATAVPYRDGSAPAYTVTGTFQSATPNASGNLSIGSNDGANFFWQGNVAEYIVYDRALTREELASVEAYLASKWGISGVHAPAVTASDPVGYWKDRSGNGRHATQSTAASRPVVGAQNGRRALSANGTSQWMSMPNALGVARNVPGLTIMAAVNPNTASGARSVAFWSVGTSSAARSLFQFENAAVRAGGRRNDADSFDSATAGVITANQPMAAIASLDYANARATAFVNGVAFAEDASFLTAGNTSDTDSQAASIMSSAGSLFYSGVFAELAAWPRVLTLAERRKMERYLARRWGITLAPQVSNAEAQDWISRVYAAGSTVSQPVANAVSAFVDGCQADGIWDAMKSVVLLAGADTLAGALAPLKGTAPTPYNFASGDYNKTSGLKGNGSSAYLDTNRANTADPQDSKHLALFVSDDSTDGGAVRGLIYAGDNGTAGSSGIGYRNSDGISLFQANNASAYVPTIASLAGLAGVTRSSSAGFVARYNGSNVSVTAASDSPAAGNLFAYRRNGTNYSSARLSFYSIGEAVDLALLDARVSALMTAIGVS